MKFPEIIEQAKTSVNDFLSAIVTQHEVEVKEAADKAVAEYVAAAGEEKIYSQAQLDAKVQEKVQEAVAPLQAQVDAFPAQLEQAKADAAAQAVVEYKAKLKQAYADQQVVESQSETGFAALLD